ncbi:MAG: GH3 auxin-responsive promoter family protein [Candidatus Thorarchaeota archaeon]|nr:GH3 auxin-responsive promoter family protein [Candidatus Thorarchaeota archaeon]
MTMLKRLVKMVAEKKAHAIDKMLEHQQEVMESKLTSILRRHHDTVYGRKYGFESIRTAEQYAERVPLVDAEKLRPYFGMTYVDPKGGILTKDPVIWYLQTSGTTGHPKRVPITRPGLKDSSRGSAMTWMSFINAEEENADILDGTLVTFGAASVLDWVNGIPVGYATGVYARHQNRLFQRLIKPGEDIFNITDMDTKMRAYARILATENVTGLQGITTLSLSLIRRMQDQYGPWLAEELSNSEGRNRILASLDDEGRLDVSQLWPNLRLFLASGIDTTPYKVWMTKTFPNLSVVEIYGASEGVFAGQLLEPQEGMQLFANTHYFEFIRENDANEPNPAVIPLSEVKVGSRYEIVLTNIQGYYRYRLGDVMTFTSTDPYSVSRISRRGKVVNLSGEKVSDAHASIAMSEACRRTGAQVVDYTLLGVIENGIGHYTIAALFRDDSVDSIEFVQTFEESMMSINPEFRVVREVGALGPTVLKRLKVPYFDEVVKQSHLQAKPHCLTTSKDVLSLCES